MSMSSRWKICEAYKFHKHTFPRVYLQAIKLHSSERFLRSSQGGEYCCIIKNNTSDFDPSLYFYSTVIYQIPMSSFLLNSYQSVYYHNVVTHSVQNICTQSALNKATKYRVLDKLLRPVVNDLNAKEHNMVDNRN